MWVLDSTVPITVHAVVVQLCWKLMMYKNIPTVVSRSAFEMDQSKNMIRFKIMPFPNPFLKIGVKSTTLLQQS